MTNTLKDESEGANSTNRWPLIGLGGAVSLCCLFAAPVATGVAGATVTGGATTGFGSGLARILVSAIAASVIGIVLRVWSSRSSCER